jgi:hypothetical protein
VETPQGLKRGSGHADLGWTDKPDLGKYCTWMFCGRPPELHGTAEAVTVDLGGGKLLFVLLGGHELPFWLIDRESVEASLPAEDGPDSPGIGAGTNEEKGDKPKPARDERHADGDERPELPPRLGIPYFVTFRDPARFETIERVAPLDLAKTFGPGYRLKSLTLKPRPGIGMSLAYSHWLPWVQSLPPRPTTATVYSPFPKDLTRESFYYNK